MKNLFFRTIGRVIANKRMVGSVVNGVKEDEVILVNIFDDLKGDSQGLAFNKKTGAVEALRTNLSSKARTAEEFRKLYSEKKLFAQSDCRDVLKNFDDADWSSFVGNHLNPVITNILPIREKRDLILDYKFCLPPTSFKETPAVTRERAMRNLAKAVHFFPMLAKSLFKDRAGDGLDIFHNIALGASSKPSEKLVKYLKIPNATAGFVKRISGFTEQHLVEDLYKYVFGEIDVKNPSDKKLLNLRISELPLVKDEERYGSMLRVLQSLHGSFLQKESRAKLFNNIQKQDWQKNSQALDQNFYPSLQHYLSSISLFLVLPEYIKKFDEEIEKVNLSTFRKKDYFPKEFNHWLVSHVADELALLIEDKFLSKSTPKKINDKVAEFDKRTAAIDDKRPIFLERKREFERNNYQSNPQWYKLFDDCEVDGFKFRCLCNEAELAKEAQEVSHCAGGYGHRCISGIRHLVSMTGPNGERATLRLDKDGSKVGGVSFGEVVVLDKKSSSNKIEEVARSFANDVSENKIKISSKLGATDANYSVSEMLGFDQNDERSCEQIFVACRDAGALPTTAQTFDEFKKEIGLDDYLSKKIPQHIVLSSNNDVAPPAIAARIAERVKDFGPRENAPRWD